MKKSLMSKPVLSVIILNYNAGSYLSECLKSIYQSDLNHPIELIVVDNASTDNSVDQARQQKLHHSHILKTEYLILDRNLGFAAGNNQGIKIISEFSKYVLFLNPDTTVNPDTLSGMIDYFISHPNLDAATCYVTLALTGQLQPECHRGFPTPWNTFWHFFGFGIPQLFPKSAALHGYLMDYLDYSKVQKIDCCVGAFFMMKREVGKHVGWWNEKYFFYGEDLDFCFKLRQNNFQLYFIPQFKITHYQGVSSGIISHTQKISQATRATKVRAAKASVNAMRIFVKENLLASYPQPLHWLILLGIQFLEVSRVVKAKYL